MGGLRYVSTYAVRNHRFRSRFTSPWYWLLGGWVLEGSVRLLILMLWGVWWLTVAGAVGAVRLVQLAVLTLWPATPGRHRAAP